MLDDLIKEVSILRRIDHIDSTTQDGDGSPSSLEGPLVSQGINPPRHSADNGDPMTGKILAYLFCEPPPIRRGLSAPDNGNGQFILSPEFSPHIKKCWKIVDILQTVRIGVVLKSNYLSSRLLNKDNSLFTAFSNGPFRISPATLSPNPSIFIKSFSDSVKPLGS